MTSTLELRKPTTGLVLPRVRKSWAVHNQPGIYLVPFSLDHLSAPAPPNPAWGVILTDMSNALFDITNAFRYTKGINPLKKDSRLMASSGWKSMSMAGYQYMDHNDPDPAWPGGRTFAQRLYSYYPTNAAVGENIEYGATTAQDAFALWIGQGPGEGHYDNIVDEYWVGAGMVMAQASNGLIFATQDFGSDPVDIPPAPNDTTPPSVPTNLRLINATDTSLSVAWNASTDNNAVRAYGFYLNDIKIGETPALAATCGGLGFKTEYKVTVDAVDYNGNRSKVVGGVFSTTGSVTPPPQPIPPPQPVPPPVTHNPAVGQTWRRLTNKRLGKIIRVSPNGTVTWKSNAASGATVSKPVAEYMRLFTYVSG